MKVEIGPYTDNGVEDINIVIDDYDTWNMDHTLAYIVLPMLKQLKETKHGAPNVDWNDVPRKLRPSAEELRNYNRNGETDVHFFERWDYILDEMIYSFDCKVNKDDVIMRFDINDKRGVAKEQKRISNGFRLFGKYYESLWD